MHRIPCLLAVLGLGGCTYVYYPAAGQPAGSAYGGTVSPSSQRTLGGSGSDIPGADRFLSPPLNKGASVMLIKRVEVSMAGFERRES